jgi:2-iminobutanoate/2-iminopropanoate deaminase
MPDQHCRDPGRSWNFNGKIASATVILADEDDFAGMNEEWMRWFPVNPPARQGAKLPVRIPGLKISIAVIAAA